MGFKDIERRDPNFVFALERNVTKILFLLVLFLSCLLGIAILAIFVMIPLKETKPYLVFFSNPQGSFVRVENNNFDIRSDEALLKSIVAGYVLKRETINRIDDELRYREIALQSANKIYKIFENAVSQKNSIYQTQNLYREIEIINTSIISKEVAMVDYIAKIRQGEIQTDFQRYRATLKFGFEEKEMTHESVPMNPTGFIVYEYALSKINPENEEKK